MDEFEKEALPREPEHMEEPAAQEVPAAPVPEETPAAPVQQPPRPRSPYENSPYMRNKQQTPAAPAPKAEEPAKSEAPEQIEKPRKKRGVRVWLVTAALILAVIGLVVAAANLTALQYQKQARLQIRALESQIEVLRQQLEAQSNDASGNSVSGTPNGSADGLTPAQVYAMNQKSVVLIETDMATGSGFILTADGYVVTNFHVVEDGSEISVVLHDRSAYPARLVGYEASNDVALLKMEGEGFRPVTLGSSDALIVGDQVAAIGNPLGELTSTLTVGFVSAKERDISTDSTVINMLQTDCAINSGNSGGPLFNMKGEVVGITTAKYSGLSASGASIEGIGFAVPMDDVVDILEDLMVYGYVKSAYLGVSVYSMDPAEASMFNLPLGSLVDSVTRGSCADIAGVKPSDIIIGLDGYLIESNTDLLRALRNFEGGEETTITVYRSGQTLVLPIILDEKPRENTPAAPETNPMPENGSYEEWYDYFFGN